VIHAPIGCVSILELLLVRGILGWASAIGLAALLVIEKMNQVHPAMRQGLADNIVELIVEHLANAFDDRGLNMPHGASCHVEAPVSPWG
jgi:hypothetical protein